MVVKFEWKTMESAPKDGTEILLCLPGGNSDHYHVVCWTDDEDTPEPCWKSRFEDNRHTVTDSDIAGCHLAPMWTEIPPPPSSLCYLPGDPRD